MLRTAVIALFLSLASPAMAERTPAPDGAELYFVSPSEGEVVSGEVRVVFGLRGMGVAPAGVSVPKTGHHHLLIDTELADFGAPIPADEKHVHFGAGQTETVIELKPGEHTLRLVLGDHLHRPHDPPVVSETITITVE